MEREHVISVIESLGHGINPLTDTPVDDPLLNHPVVVRACLTAAALLQRLPNADLARPAKPPSAGARWTDGEDSRLLCEYDSGLTFTDIARRHARSTGAVMSRLVKLGRIDADTLEPRLRAQTLVAAPRPVAAAAEAAAVQ